MIISMKDLVMCEHMNIIQNSHDFIPIKTHGLFYGWKWCIDRIKIQDHFFMSILTKRLHSRGNTCYKTTKILTAGKHFFFKGVLWMRQKSLSFFHKREKDFEPISSTPLVQTRIRAFNSCQQQSKICLLNFQTVYLSCKVNKHKYAKTSISLWSNH